MDYQLGPGPLQVDQNTIDEKIKGDIGIVENGDVATHAIPSGYYVIWKGDLYIAKTNISSGTTLSAASNGNLTAKPNGLGAEVAALNSKITPDDTYDLGTTIFQRFKSAHRGVGIYGFYVAPSDIPSGQSLGSWYYLLVTFKVSTENQIKRGDYCLLFYPGMLFMGEMAADANSIVWRKVSIT